MKEKPLWNYAYMIKCGDGASGETRLLSAFGGKSPSGETRLHFLPVGKKIEVATSVCTGGSNMPLAYCDLIFRVSTP